VALLDLERREGAAREARNAAGLYHTAFLMPTRADLAAWVLKVAGTRVPVTGASDHGVSEAIYLDDPEGNGIEVYSDRPPETWTWRSDLVDMPTVALDLQDLVSAADGAAGYGEAPAGLRIGHIHLRVGALDAAQAFYVDGIGLVPTRRRGGALFMSSARYHHHVATNVWHSQNAGPRDPKRAGLAWFSIHASDGADIDAMATRLRAAGASVTPITDGFETADPWGTHIRIVRT
jgi:catechol 2,3-dioxygenase